MSKLSQVELEKFLTDARWEVSWRAEADLAAAYYDNKQLTPEIVTEMKERGLAPLVRNYIAPVINTVLGIEAKAKRDYKVVADEETEVDVTHAMSLKLKQAERVSGADRATSDAYASAIKTGIGWVEVAREANPFRSPYRVRAVHRREIIWDFRAKEPDLSDARYLIRKQWIDEDIVKLHFPGKAKLIQQAMTRWANWDEALAHDDSALAMVDSYNAETSSSLDDTEWRDTERKRVCVYEVWYRVWQNGLVLTLPSGDVVEYDEANPAHVEAVATDQVELRQAVYPTVRLAWYVGPHFLSDNPSPYLHGHFPYVPFWGYREDGIGAPYGIVRLMMSPQDEINARLSKMMWLLSAKRIIADSDAVDMPWREIAEEAGRPDAVLLMNPNRKNKTSDALRVETDFQLSQQQFTVLQDATKATQDVAGVYQAMMGKSEYAGQSGLAINSLVEQGSTTLAEINDNYRFARRQVGVLLLSYIKEDMGTAPHRVVIDDKSDRRVVVLNQPGVDAQGKTYITNDIAATQMRVELEDVPDTPSFRLQMMTMMAEIVKSMPPEIQPLFADFIVLASDLPFRHELAERIAQKTGVAPPKTSTDPNQAAAQQALQQQQEYMQSLQQQQAESALQEQQAKTQKAMAEVDLLKAKAMQVGMQTQETGLSMAHAEDDHSLSLDERSVALVQSLQAPPEVGGKKTPAKK